MTKTIEHTTLSFTKADRYFKCQTTVKINDTKKKLATYAKTRKEANAKMLEKLEKLSEVQDTAEKKAKPEKQLLGSAILEYNNQTDKIKGNKESTICYLNQYLRCHILPYPIANKEVGEITHADVTEWVDQLKKAKKSESVQKKAYNVMSSFFSYYYRDTPSRNPASGLHFEQHGKEIEADQILNDDEMKWLMRECEAAADEPNSDIIEILLMSYMRSGELIALQVKDWLDNEQTLCIRKTLTRDKEGHYCIREQTKTKTSKRNLQVNDIVYELIQLRLIEMESKHGYLKPNWFIFHSEKSYDKPISRTAVRHLLQRMLYRSGIRKNVRVHDLRHSGISFFLRNKGILADVSKRAGHSKQSITADLYNHAIEESLRIQNSRESQLAVTLVEDVNLHTVKTA